MAEQYLHFTGTRKCLSDKTVTFCRYPNLMRMVRTVVMAFVFTFAALLPAWGQKNEVGLLLGGSIVPTSASNLSINSGLAYQATFARRFTNNGTGFGFEVPFVALPSQSVQSNSIFVPRNYASIFLTPGFRVTFASHAAISPWASVGGGYARFAESTTLVTGAPNTFTKGTNKGALQFGGGVDFRTPIKFLALRAEIRDFFTGEPRLNFPRPGSGQHNVITSGGFVLRF
jgi:hypothetical protein